MHLREAIDSSRLRARGIDFVISIHFKWLVYSPSAKGGYCKYCVLFFAKDDSARTKPGVLVATPFTNFGKATGKGGILTSHEKL